MSGYLQRLLDRGAGLVAAPAAAAEIVPAMASGSPVVAYDQRLAAPGLAQDYGILGLPPDSETGAAPDAPGDAMPSPAQPPRPVPTSRWWPAPCTWPRPRG